MGPDGASAEAAAAAQMAVDPSAYSSMIAALDDETATSILCQILGNKPNIVPGVVGFSAQLQEAVAMGAAQTAADYRQAAEALTGAQPICEYSQAEYDQVAAAQAAAARAAQAEQAAQSAHARQGAVVQIQTTAKSGSPALPNGYAPVKGNLIPPPASAGGGCGGAGGLMRSLIEEMDATGAQALLAQPVPVVGPGRQVGIIKAFNVEKGYGFIFSAEVKAQFGCDVFLHHQQMVGFNMGSEVSFTLKLNKNGKPQAIELLDATGVLAAQEAEIAQELANAQAHAEQAQWMPSNQVMPAGQAPGAEAQSNGGFHPGVHIGDAEQAGWDLHAVSRAIADAAGSAAGIIMPQELMGVAPLEVFTSEGIVGVAPPEELCGEKRPSTIPSIPREFPAVKKPRV